MTAGAGKDEMVLYFAPYKTTVINSYFVAGLIFIFAYQAVVGTNAAEEKRKR
jgi:hypothetical protein